MRSESQLVIRIRKQSNSASISYSCSKYCTTEDQKEEEVAMDSDVDGEAAEPVRRKLLTSGDCRSSLVELKDLVRLAKKIYNSALL